MRFGQRPGVFPAFFGGLAMVLGLAWTAAVPLAAPARAQEFQQPALHITNYVINAVLDPSAHRISATAQVTFTAPPPSKMASRTAFYSPRTIRVAS